MIRQTFHLPDRQIKRLKNLKKETELNMADHVRRALDDYFEKLKRTSRLGGE